MRAADILYGNQITFPIAKAFIFNSIVFSFLNILHVSVLVDDKNREMVEMRFVTNTEVSQLEPQVFAFTFNELLCHLSIYSIFLSELRKL